MTIESNISSQTLLADGEVKVFPFTFKVFNEQVKVIATSPDNSEEDITHLCHILINKDGGGVVTYPTIAKTPALPPGYKITIMRSMDFTQETNLVTGSRYSSEVLEQCLDKLTAQDQELKEELSRTLKVGVASDIPSENIIQEVFNASSEAKTAAQSSCLDAENAASSAELAHKWAANPEDVPVGEDAESLPEFSAKHYASKLAAMLENAGIGNPEAPGFVPAGGEVGQFFGVKQVSIDAEEGENPTDDSGENAPGKNVYGFFDLPASVEPAAGMMPLGDEDGKIERGWLHVVGEITSVTQDDYLPDVGAVKKHVQKYLGNNPFNTDVWITSSGNWVSPITGTINVLLVGGGGKGGNEIGSSGAGSGPGGGSGQIILASVNVTKNNSYPITIGGSRGQSSGFGQTASPGQDGVSGSGGKGGNGTSGGGGGNTAGGATAGSSIWLGGRAGSAGNASAGGAGGASTATFPFQVATAGGATANHGGGGGSTGIVTNTGSLISAGRGGGSAGYGGKGYGAGGGGASYSGSTIGGAGAPGVCIISYYDPDKE